MHLVDSKCSEDLFHRRRLSYVPLHVLFSTTFLIGVQRTNFLRGRFVELFLLSPMKDRVLKKVIAAIPLLDKGYRAKKALLLRTIEGEVSHVAVTESMLDIFEMIEDLDKSEGVEIMESMKAAYCAVAVECTVKYLLGSNDRHGRYFDAVKRIWRGRVAEMERLGKSELVSFELKRWKDEVEVALWDTTVGKKMMNLNTRNDALRLIGKYLDEAWAILGPLSPNVRQPDQLERKSPIKENSERVDKTTIGIEDIGGSRGTEMPSQTANYAEPVRQGGIEGLSEVERKHSCSPNINLDLSVNDDLNELAIVVVSNLAEKSTNVEHSPEKRNDAETVNPATEKGDEPLQSVNAALEKPIDQKTVSWPRLMEHNTTAGSHECEDSISDSPEGVSNQTSRLHLPSPKRKAISPLKKCEVTKFSRRRKIKRWSSLEEDTLRTAVQKFGKGNWKLILSNYRDVFEERTEVDLKDKWRNMSR